MENKRQRQQGRKSQTEKYPYRLTMWHVERRANISLEIFKISGDVRWLSEQRATFLLLVLLESVVKVTIILLQFFFLLRLEWPVYHCSKANQTTLLCKITSLCKSFIVSHLKIKKYNGPDRMENQESPTHI